MCFYNPFRYYLKVLVSQHVLESRSQILGLQCTFGWMPKQTSLPFFDYIRNATRWPGTSLLGHWCSWNNMGNIVGMSRWASRDRDFYTPIRPQMYYDEHAEVMSVKVVMKMCFPQNLVVVARNLPNHKTNILCVSFLTASHHCMRIVELLQRGHAHIFRQKLHPTLHFCTFNLVILFS